MPTTFETTTAKLLPCTPHQRMWNIQVWFSPATSPSLFLSTALALIHSDKAQLQYHVRDYFSAASAYSKIRKYQKSQWTGCYQCLWLCAQCHIHLHKDNCPESTDRQLQSGLKMVNTVMELKGVTCSIRKKYVSMLQISKVWNGFSESMQRVAIFKEWLHKVVW